MRRPNMNSYSHPGSRGNPDFNREAMAGGPCRVIPGLLIPFQSLEIAAAPREWRTVSALSGFASPLAKIRPRPGMTKRRHGKKFQEIFKMRRKGMPSLLKTFSGRVQKNRLDTEEAMSGLGSLPRAKTRHSFVISYFIFQFQHVVLITPWGEPTRPEEPSGYNPSLPETLPPG